jgi:NAD kinase
MISMKRFTRIVIVARKTQLEELLHRFITKEQAKFYIEHMGLSFSDYEAADTAYKKALEKLNQILPESPRHQIIDRSYLPTFSFFERDLVITLGNNGSVVNTAKYLDGQPILGINADPEREEGILVPFEMSGLKRGIQNVLSDRFITKSVTMAKAVINDGQELLGFNDLFVGHKSHVSARYRIVFNGYDEIQSSSGIIISTGAGSTGWMKSIITGAFGISNSFLNTNEIDPKKGFRFDWSSDHLVFAVREPWISKRTGASIIFGKIDKKHPLKVISQIPEGGVIFSDGIEEDAISFTSGSIATIGMANKKANLITSIS